MENTFGENAAFKIKSIILENKMTLTAKKKKRFLTQNGFYKMKKKKEYIFFDGIREKANHGSCSVKNYHAHCFFVNKSIIIYNCTKSDEILFALQLEFS